MNSTVLGVDPGAFGALVILQGDDTLTIIDTPTIKIQVGKKLRSRIDCYSLANSLRSHGGRPALAVIEALHSRPQQSAQSQFALGHAVGIVEMAVASLEIPTHFVAPQIWQKAMRVQSDADGNTKGSSRARAAALFPKQAHLFSRVKDDGRADAALMAWYGREFA